MLRNRVVRLIDCSDITIAVYCGCKATSQVHCGHEATSQQQLRLLMWSTDMVMFYFVGESIAISAEFDNHSKRTVIPYATLYQTQAFFANGKSRVRKIKFTVLTGRQFWLCMVGILNICTNCIDSDQGPVVLLVCKRIV